MTPGRASSRPRSPSPAIGKSHDRRVRFDQHRPRHPRGENSRAGRDGAWRRLCRHSRRQGRQSGAGGPARRAPRSRWSAPMASTASLKTRWSCYGATGSISPLRAASKSRPARLSSSSTTGARTPSSSPPAPMRTRAPRSSTRCARRGRPGVAAARDAAREVERPPSRRAVAAPGSCSTPPGGTAARDADRRASTISASTTRGGDRRRLARHLRVLAGRLRARDRTPPRASRRS